MHMTQKTALHLYKYGIFTKFYTQFPTPLDTEKRENKQKKSNRGIIGTYNTDTSLKLGETSLRFLQYNRAIQIHRSAYTNSIVRFCPKKYIKKELSRGGRRGKGKQKLTDFKCRCQEKISTTEICNSCLIFFFCFFLFPLICFLK